mmetsp:Transcript_5160/g.11211  ORF Transcript_5160/g.11211 Transcript_5160/m.11211 type:complete len:420 (-) Transcript_5160:345-1604(-)
MWTAFLYTSSLLCCCSTSSLSSPSASSTNVVYGLAPTRAPLSVSPALRTFSMPSRATVTRRGSLHVSRSQSGLMQPCWTRYLICSGEPPEVAFEIDHAASFRMSNSAVASRCTSGGMMFASITDWICSRVPAVMLEMVQHASLRIPFLGELRRASSRGSAPLLITCCVWLSSPVTMLPVVRSAGVCTDAGGWPISSTMRAQMPVSSTAWMFSLGPSERYESAQHASASTSSSLEKMSWARMGSDGATSCQMGCGLPRHKLESVQVALRSIDILEVGCSCSSSGLSAPWQRTRSRHSGESPAMLPRAHTACSRTSSLGLMSSCTKMGTAPLAMTTRVCSDVPEAMLVSAHADSNWSIGLSPHCRKLTKRGTTPAEMTSSIGGERSIDSNFLNCVTAFSCVAGSSQCTPSTSFRGSDSAHA